MLHPPISETKTETTQSKSQLAPQPGRELHPHAFGAAGAYTFSGAGSTAPVRSPGAQRHQIFAGMQATHGNQAVLRMMQSSPQVAGMPALRPSQGVMLQRKCACGGTPESTGECAECKAKWEGALQHRAMNENLSPKLVINKPGDRYEQEANLLADQVMRIPEENIQHHIFEKEREMASANPACGLIPSFIQRQADDKNQPDQQNAPKTDEGPTEEELIEMEEANVAPSLQRKHQIAANNESKDGQKSLRSVLAQRNEGRPLDHITQSFMEHRFKHDFSQVRIHTDDRADKAAHSIRARAFTVGQNIWFAHGEFSPSTYAGRHLLAHELTHTIQQRGNSVSTIQRVICPDHCVPQVNAGHLCESNRVIRDHCRDSNAANADDMITHIQVIIDTRRVYLFWNGAPGTPRGRRVEIDCTPNPRRTPRGPGIIGRKCGINHTTHRGRHGGIHNMAYFTAFHGNDMRFGFHDSQPLGSGFHSAGCVRVSCEDAQTINENTSSGTTTVEVL